ncbi:hypothetical protein VSDG_00887 [Cytospora chrysosperma]|uniref:Uncharacterized protein n=1 Tax=Cytospora chrysosperma TaxID=252740 RepID=A0A423WKW9_CYTCH|nr:hypothetical protein VSDG_00887 [Valsa sordida]
MDTLNKVLHPKQTLHKTDDDTDYAGTQTPPSHTNDPMRPNQETRDALTSEPNVTGTDRPAPREEFPAPHHSSSEQEAQQAPRISRGHHHPRQPVGATGLPPNHRPGQECGPAGPGA